MLTFFAVANTILGQALSTTRKFCRIECVLYVNEINWIKFSSNYIFVWPVCGMALELIDSYHIALVHFYISFLIEIIYLTNLWKRHYRLHLLNQSWVVI